MVEGITQNEEKIIKDILKDYPYDFYYYGSRVKGDYTKGSDLDILIKNDNEIPQNIIEELNLKFNVSIIPYKVNFCDFALMDTHFYELIKNDLVKI